MRRQVQITIKQLENLAIKYLKKVPALKQYAKRPYVTYLVYAALLAPIVTLLVPLLTLTKGGLPTLLPNTPLLPNALRGTS